MTFFEKSCGALSVLQWSILLLRMLLATGCGAVVGLERTRRLKDAGIRTHSMVACTAALLMIISKYGFADLVTAGGYFPGIREADPARIAAQVVSGVSFLGVGIIYRDRKYNTRGLTTAAGVWAVAGIGMAIGCGLYMIGIFATILIMFLQWFTHRHSVGADRYGEMRLEVITSGDGSSTEELLRQLENYGAIVTDTQISRREEGGLRYQIVLKLKNNSTGAVLKQCIAEFSDTVSVRMIQEMW